MQRFPKTYLDVRTFQVFAGARGWPQQCYRSGRALVTLGHPHVPGDVLQPPRKFWRLSADFMTCCAAAKSSTLILELTSPLTLSFSLSLFPPRNGSPITIWLQQSTELKLEVSSTVRIELNCSCSEGVADTGRGGTGQQGIPTKNQSAGTTGNQINS